MAHMDDQKQPSPERGLQHRHSASARSTLAAGVVAAPDAPSLVFQASTGAQANAIHEVTRRVQACVPFDVTNPHDITTIAQFLSTGGNAIVPFDYMYCWVSHPGPIAVRQMLDTGKGRNPTTKPASIAIRPAAVGPLIDSGGVERDALTAYLIQALLQRVGAGVRFLASPRVPVHFALAHAGHQVAQVIAPPASSDFYHLLDAFQHITGLEMLAITSANWTNERGPHYRLQAVMATLGTMVPVLGVSDADLRRRQLQLVQARMRGGERGGRRARKLTPDGDPEQVRQPGAATNWPFKLSSTTIVTACEYREVAGVLTLVVEVVRHGSVHVDELRSVVRMIDGAVQERFKGRARVVASDEPAPPRLWARRYGARS